MPQTKSPTKSNGDARSQNMPQTSNYHPPMVARVNQW